ncbi:MAG: hypothetical protein GXP55_01330 [Deltaproteobacteria bacterium]|nr:hypothetical protein [Deltaproteobacteria bacterium]
MKKIILCAAALSLAFTFVSHEHGLDAASAQEAAPAEPAAGGLSVTELVLSKGFADHAPVNPSTSFSRSDGRIYATIHLANPARTATTIRVAFEREGAGGHGGVSLDVPARARYRTLARTGTARAAGSYRCVVYDAEGHELSAAPFTITE